MDYYKIEVTDADGNTTSTAMDGNELDIALMAFLRRLACDTKVTLTYVGEVFDEGG